MRLFTYASAQTFLRKLKMLMKTHSTLIPVTMEHVTRAVLRLECSLDCLSAPTYR